MSANDKQIGGDHYKTSYQHWDAIIDIYGPEYLLGCASKYIVRWRKKNGLEDLKKSVHYIEKTIEEDVPTTSQLSFEEREEKVDNLLEGYPELTDVEKEIVRVILTCDDPRDWSAALVGFKQFVKLQAGQN